uniref:Uncharacterized protein n=1 Tax=Oryza brachyantha TaxID=4533 RepID=J3MEC1_ORYBR
MAMTVNLPPPTPSMTYGPSYVLKSRSSRRVVAAASHVKLSHKDLSDAGSQTVQLYNSTGHETIPSHAFSVYNKLLNFSVNQSYFLEIFISQFK